MRLRCQWALAFAILVAAAALPIAGQPHPSRTPDGRPDFQGTWANNTVTPFLRPKALADKAFLTNDELAVLKERAARLFNGDGDTAPGDELFEALLANPKQHTTNRPTGDYNQFWTAAPFVFEHRTSQIVEHFHVVERLTRLDADTMQYQVTVDDPTTWTTPWTAMTTWKRSSARIYEVACHDVNYSMEGILRGARAEEKAR